MNGECWLWLRTELLGHFSFWISFFLSRIAMCTHRPRGVRAVPEIILGGGRQFFLTCPSPGHAERHKRPPQDKSEYQLPPPHLNIFVPPPLQTKKPLPPTPLRIISGTALIMVGIYMSSNIYYLLLYLSRKELCRWICLQMSKHNIFTKLLLLDDCKPTVCITPFCFSIIIIINIWGHVNAHDN